MDPWFYKFARPIVTAFMKIVYRPQIINKENIPKTERLVLAGTHTNFFDCLLLISSTKRCIHFLAKDSLMKGIKGILFKNMAIIPVNRSIKDKWALSTAEEFLEKEKLIGIFPEGTINRTDDVIMPFKIGAVKMASDTHSTITPFAIVGEYKPFKKGLTIVFGKPYKITAHEDLTDENEILMDKVKELIKIGETYGKN